MSRHHWRCRNPACLAPSGAHLGRLVHDGHSLVLDSGVRRFAVYLDTQRAEITCPVCGTVRLFRGLAVMRGDDG
ncbi:MAG: hypothetical protein QM753_13205 [Thermomicrobiales bacterium]